MRQGFRIGVLAIAMMAPSCGINTHLPASRLESPETYGRAMAFGIDVGVQGSNSLGLTSDYTISPVDTDTPSYSRSRSDVKLGVGVGVAERFDLAVKTAWDSPFQLQGKYQLLGDSRGKAREGNSSLAVTAAIGNHAQSGSSDGLSGDEESSYEMTAYMADGAAIAGYRLSDAALVFGGPFIQKYWISGTHVLDGAPERAYDLDAHQYGVNIGVGFTIYEKFELMIEAVFAESRASDANVRSGFLGAHMAIMKF
jgi:hypothetical protein